MNGKISKVKVLPFSEMFMYWIFFSVLIKGSEKGMKRSEIKKALPEDVIKIRNLDRIIEKILNKMIVLGVVETEGRLVEGRLFKLTDSGRLQAEALNQYFKKES